MVLEILALLFVLLFDGFMLFELVLRFRGDV